MGRNATLELLPARAIPDGCSPKRTMSMEIDTPVKRPCNRAMEIHNTSSPNLRTQPKPRTRVISTGGRGRGPKKIAARLNWESTGNDKKDDESMCDGSKKLTKQPLISAMFDRKRDEDGNQ